MTELFTSKKFQVYAISTAVVMASKFLGLATEQVDEIMMLSVAFMGSQGVADLGKYFGLKAKSGE